MITHLMPSALLSLTCLLALHAADTPDPEAKLNQREFFHAQHNLYRSIRILNLTKTDNDKLLWFMRRQLVAQLGTLHARYKRLGSPKADENRLATLRMNKGLSSMLYKHLETFSLDDPQLDSMRGFVDLAKGALEQMDGTGNIFGHSFTLSAGMSQDEVIKIMGKPTRNSSNSLTFQMGSSQPIPMQSYSFKDGKLVDTEGEYEFWGIGR